MRTFVLHEDRPDQMLGLKLCLLSLARHQPADAIVVHVPPTLADVEAWVRQNVPRAQVRTSDSIKPKGWNVKPTLLLEALARGAGEAVWLDSDVIVARSLADLLDRRTEETLVLASDHHRAREAGTDSRTRAWGLTVGRPLPRAANTGFVRVTRSHVPLLESWRRMLEHPDYQAAQEQPGHLRPLHQVGDQEVLTALLGSEAAKETVVSMLRAGVDMAQCEGVMAFTLRERIHAVRSGGPYLVHAMGTPKPWQVVTTEPRTARVRESARSRVGRSLRACHALLGPYSCLAAGYADGFTGEPAWFDSLPWIARRCDSSRWSPLPEIPIVLAVAIADRFPRVGT